MAEQDLKPLTTVAGAPVPDENSLTAGARWAQVCTARSR